MIRRISTYEKAKRAIRMKKAQEYMLGEDLFDDEIENGLVKRKTDFIDIAKVGTGIVIGGGIGILSGVAAIAVSASVAEIIIGGVITKIAGVVGGATGLGLGLHAIDKKNRDFELNRNQGG